MDKKFIIDRITELRIKKGVSEYKMSYDLGHSRSYIHNISSGRSLPPMEEFLAICEYFGITPAQFFDDSPATSALISAAVDEMVKLNDDAILLIIRYMRMLNR